MYTHNSPKAFEGKTLRSLSLALASSAIVMGFIGAAMPRPVAAAEMLKPRQEIVRYRDLDLTKTADTDRLRTRIRRAAKRVCNQSGAAGLLQRSAEKRCAEQAHNNAWADATNAISHKRLAVRTARQ